MLKIITINTNGIRSAVNKGFHLWLAKQDADIVCIQELKAQPSEVPDEINLDGTFYRYVHCAEKKGYSGCAVLSRKKPDEVIIGFGNEEFDREGRYVEVRFNNLIVVSIYFPSGSSSEERQQAKFRFLDVIKGRLDELIRDGRDVVLCGDFNIAHKEIDIKNWKGNLKNSGFLPEERQWITDRAGRMSFDASIRVPIALPGGATEDALESIMSDGESTTSSQPRQLLPPQKKPIFIGMSVSLTTPRSPSSMILT